MHKTKLTSQCKLSVSTSLFVKRSCDSLLKLAVGISHISSIESKIVQMDHQLKILRNVTFGPVLRTTVILQIVQTDLVNAQKR